MTEPNGLESASVGESMRQFMVQLPTAVAVVAAMHEGRAYGMAVGTLTSVSLKPPLVGFLPSKESGSWAGIRQAGSFVASILATDQLDVCAHFASPQADKFATALWRPAPSGAPIIEGCLAWLECTLYSIADAGDHDFALGEVKAMAVERPGDQPLIFFRRNYHQPVPILGEDSFW